MEEVNKDIVKNLRVNEGIRASEVRLVGEKGEQLGVMPLSQALETARKSNLDLVEVATTAVPPVCRLLDYGKYKYEQTKREREARRSQKVLLLREVRIRPKIGNHDFEAKARSARRLSSRPRLNALELRVDSTMVMARPTATADSQKKTGK